MSLTFPKALEYEDQYGSVLKGFISHRKDEAHIRKLCSFKKGLSSLCDEIAKQLEHICLETEVKELHLAQSNKMTISSGETIEFEKLVFTTPTYTASKLLQHDFPQISEQLSKVSYNPMSVIHLLFSNEHIGRPISGLGGLHPYEELTFTSGTMWIDNAFPQKTKENHRLIIAFVEQVPGMLSKEEIERNTVDELQRIFHIKEEPKWIHSTFWYAAIPTYDRQLLKVREAVSHLESEDIYFRTNWADDVSLQSSVANSVELAHKL